MTGACRGRWRWSLQVVALLSLIRIIAPVYCQRTEDYQLTLLVAIKSNGSGLEIRESIGDSRTSQWPDNDLESQKGYFIPDYNLSLECGNQYFRCQELLVIIHEAQNDSRKLLNIVFIPLENGVLLLSYWYDSTWTIEKSAFIFNSSNCSPTVFYKIDGKIYTVCISSYHHHVAVYEVALQLNLNGSVNEFEDAAFIELWVTRISSVSLHSLLNFVVVDHVIFLVVRNIMIVMDVLDSERTHQIPYPELSECAQIHKLVPITTSGTGNQQLLLVAYCTDRYVYFDPVYGDWTNVQLFSSNGVPYLCPHSDYRATLFSDGTLQLLYQDLPINTINNVNISSGVCFEFQNRTYFVYSNQQNGYVHLCDFTTQNPHPLSPYDCPPHTYVHQDCPQLLFLENQYLVVRDVNHNFVFDATTNFSLLINISSDAADILAILHSNVHITPAKTFSPDIPTSITVTMHSNSIGIILTVVIGVFIIMMILVSVAVGFCIQHCRKSKWCSTTSYYRIPRLRFRTNQSPPLSLLAAGVDAQEEEDDAEGESYEMRGSMGSHSRESHFGRGWRWTTTV